ncbi:hypothetical protein [Rathayibacter sp. Leaf248]|uniref:hypothetical protein n=1 Tax=Rathayibacter sp. Leaf248 TaxID=2876555 RepID=UPI001E4E4FC5|nr:hypothetical protein [Rathayibacter sp. Leaf248]
MPEVLDSSPDFLCLEYVKGSRLFNVLVELDRLDHPSIPQVALARKLLMRRAEEDQRVIQNHLYSMRDELAQRPYPVAQKSSELYLLLGEVLGVSFSRDLLADELARFQEEWQSLCCVPFRDATTKNMLVAAPELWLGAFDGEESRSQYIEQSFRASAPDLPAWVHSPIVNFDFGSCTDLSTPEDDPISLLCHQRTWDGERATPQELLWLDSIQADARRTALSFVVRYGRFGGRKAAYRLLNSTAAMVRFRHDDARFYFDRIRSIVEALDSSVTADYPYLFALIDAIGAELAVTHPLVDHFREYSRGDARTYYVDIFPF